jgi:D-glycero-D-manno-heptose 1,7-bisphosphate phosphatase
MKLIILDRDGVINYDSFEYIKSPAEWIPIPHSLEAIAKLTKAGFTIAIATNQSGIARGLYDVDMLEQIHEKLINAVKKEGGEMPRYFIALTAMKINVIAVSQNQDYFKKLAIIFLCL